MLPLLAETDPQIDDKLRAIRLGFILIIAIGIVGILLIIALVAAWRNFHKRLAELEAERDELRRSVLPDDAWQTAGQRVAVEPPPGFDSDPDDKDEDDDELPDDDDGPPGWSPDDDEDDDGDGRDANRPW